MRSGRILRKRKTASFFAASVLFLPSGLTLSRAATTQTVRRREAERAAALRDPKHKLWNKQAPGFRSLVSGDL